MASVNGNHRKRKKDIKNNNSACLNSVCLNTVEQSELYLRALKSEKREEIETLSQKYEKRVSASKHGVVTPTILPDIL